MAGPYAQIDYPKGSSSAPTVFHNSRPVISFKYSDNDGDELKRFQVKIYEGINTLVFDSGLIPLPADDLFGSGLAGIRQSTEETTATNSITYYYEIPESAGLQYDKTYRFAVRVEDSTFAQSFYTSANDQYYYFEMNRGPVATLLSPYGGYDNPKVFHDDLTPSLSWTFIDPDQRDTQKGYQLQIVEDPRKGFDLFFGVMNVVYDTGEVISGSSSHQIPPGVLLTGKNYRWRVRVKDNHDFWGVWSEDADFYTNATPNNPLNPLPAGGSSLYPAAVSGDRTPQFTWGINDPNSQDIQDSFQVRVYEQNGALFADSGITTSSTQSWTISKKMEYDKVYQWEVRTRDPYGQWSQYTSRGWLMPIVDEVTGVAATPDNDNAANIITWDPSSTDDLEGYHVFRSKKVDGPFKRISRELITSTSWTDDHVGSKAAYFYKLQAQAGGGHTSQLSGSTDDAAAEFEFWFIGSFKFSGVTELTKKRERAQSMRVALGSTYPKRIIQDRGFIPGENISLGIYLYDDDEPGGMTGAEKYDALLDELSKTSMVSIRDPFGRQWRAAPGSFEDEQLKTGKLEYKVKFDLQEVAY